MNVKDKVENKEQFSVELTIEIGAEEFEAGLDKAYRKNRGSISVPGFRKGKAPRRVIEGMYGAATFYQDAVEELYPAACEEAIAAEGLDIVASPSIEILDVGKEGLSFKAIFTVRPEVTLKSKDYKGLAADKIIPEVTDEMVENELKLFIDRASHVESVERAAISGDTTVIDFEGFQDGIPFQGGKGENFELVLGSGSFIPGFEEQLIGMTPGEEREIDVTFPEDYQMDTLAGKPAKFRVKVNEIKAKVVPELDDEFAKDVSEFETLEAFKADLRVKVAERAMGQSDSRFRQSVLDKLGEKVTIELPAPMVEAQVDRSLDDFRSRLENQGISLEMYCQYLQTTEQLMRQELTPGAERQIRTQLALEAVARAEKIVVTDEEVRAEYERLAEGVQISVEEIERAIGKDAFRQDMERERAMTIVVENAKAREITEEQLQAEEAKAAKAAKKATEEKAEKKPAAKKPRKKAADADESAPKEEAPAKEKKPAAKKTTKTTKKAEPKTEE